MRDVHVIVPLYKRMEFFERCLNTLVSFRNLCTHLFIQYDGPLPRSVEKMCRGIPNLVLRGKPQHQGISSTLACGIRLSLDQDPDAIRLLIASDHLVPEGYADGVVEAVDKLGPHYELGKWQTHPGADSYYNKVRSSRKCISLNNGYSVCSVNELQYVCSLPSVVVGRRVSKDLADFMDSGEISSIPGISVGRLFLTFWGIRATNYRLNVFAITGHSVEHMGNAASKYDIKTPEYKKYLKELGRAGQKIKPVGHYDKVYQSGSYGYCTDFSKSGRRVGWRAVARAISKGSCVVDAGCGDGGVPVFLSQNGDCREYRGIDFCDVAIHRARNRLKSFQNYKFTTGDLHWSGFYNWDYTHFVCVNSLEHVENDLNLLSLVRTGARIVLLLARRFSEMGQVRVYSSADNIRSRFRKLVMFDTIELVKGLGGREDFLCVGRKI